MRSSWRERRACCGYLSKSRGLSPLPTGEDNNAPLLAPSRTHRIRHIHGLNFSTVASDLVGPEPLLPYPCAIFISFREPQA